MTKLPLHKSAKPTHYNESAKNYDAFNESRSVIINQTVEKILKKYKVKTVLDLTCGTGSQLFWLTEHGFPVIGSDINRKMLAIAKTKASKKKLKIPFIKGDMRSSQFGQFDAVITIFNAVGHLTKSDFEKAMRNIRHNLKDNGLYIFDIFNLDYLMQDNYITRLTIDWLKQIGETKIRDIQYSTIDRRGILASYTTSYAQTGNNEPKISRNTQTLQIYTAQQLKKMLHDNGFNIIKQCAIDGTKFIKNKTERIMTIARKS